MQNNWIIAGACALTFFACGGDGDPVVYGGSTKGAGAAGAAGAAGSSHTGGGKGTSGGAGGAPNAGGTANHAGAANAAGAPAAGGTGHGNGGSSSGSAGASPGGNASSGGDAGSSGNSGASGDGGMAGSEGTTDSGGSSGTGGASPVAFYDDFEDGNSDGWSESTNHWRVFGGTYGHDQYNDAAVRFTAAGDSNWTDVDVVSRVMLTNVHDLSSSSYAGACARVQDPNNNYCIVLRSDHSVAIRKTVAGSSTTIGPTLGTTIETGVWHTIRIIIVGNTITAWFGGLEVGTVVDSDLSAGGIGLVTHGASAEFDEVSASPP